MGPEGRDRGAEDRARRVFGRGVGTWYAGTRGVTDEVGCGDENAAAQRATT